ncbi:glycosyltransferase family 2 protein [Aeromonas dhakensis]|uniref:glycosyltransferase family 2 protein n=1 Tax=Aeromonas dhakensis TaxID=196024 RepID=UPI00208E7C1A|nr:glycosyltransferase family A protein [Aeromonas dhakensis]USP10218.1 glycosyltransferase family 2 protein [Aeromonas dhakensis]
MKYDLSIIIPAYNAEYTIRTAIESVYKCFKYFHVEVIVVDDRSTDKTVAIVECMAKANNNISFFHTLNNSGAGVARNVGVSKAQGEYIAFLDADDYYLPCINNVFSETLEKRPDVTVYNYIVKDQKGRASGNMMARDSQIWACIKEFSGRLTAIKSVPAVLRLAGFPWNKFISHNFAIKIGMEFSNTYVLNDVYANFQCLLQSNSILILDNKAICHIYESNRLQLTNSSDYRRVKALSVLFDIDRLLESNPALLSFREYVYAFQDDVVDWVYANASAEDQSEIANVHLALQSHRMPVDTALPLFEDKNLILYGLGWQMMKYYDHIASYNKVIGFMDSQLSKSSHTFLGLNIYHPADVNIPEYDYIVICSSAFEQIHEQLVQFGKNDKVLYIEQLVKHSTII